MSHIRWAGVFVWTRCSMKRVDLVTECLTGDAKHGLNDRTQNLSELCEVTNTNCRMPSRISPKDKMVHQPIVMTDNQGLRHW